jgi:hypothetical protein
MSVISFKLMFFESDESLEVTFYKDEYCKLYIGNFVTYSFYLADNKLQVDCSETIADLPAAYRLDSYERIISDDYTTDSEFNDEIKCVVCWGVNYCVEKGCLETPCGKVCA